MANIHLTVTNTPPHPKNLVTKKIKTAFNKACDLKLQHSHTFLNLEAGLQGKKNSKLNTSHPGLVKCKSVGSGKQ